MPTLLEIIAPRINLNLSRRPGEGTKVVRHADPRWEVRRLLKESEDDFRLYQSLQDQKIFECDQIIVFIGEGSTKSRLASRCVCGGPARFGPRYSVAPEVRRLALHVLLRALEGSWAG